MQPAYPSWAHQTKWKSMSNIYEEPKYLDVSKTDSAWLQGGW